MNHVRTKLLGSYLIFLIFMAAAGIFSYKKLADFSVRIDDLSTHLSSRLILAKDMTYHTAMIREHAKTYAVQGGTASLNGFNRHMARLNQSIESLAATSLTPENISAAHRVADAARQYSDTFSQLAALMDQRQKIIFGTLNAARFDIENRLSALRMVIPDTNDPRIFLSFGNIQDAFLRMLLHVSEYTKSGDERHAVLFDKAFHQALASLDLLKEYQVDTGNLTNTRDARTAMLDYAHGFYKIRDDTREQGGLLKQMITHLEPVITKAASALTADIEQQYQAHNRESRDILTASGKILILFTGMAVILGIIAGLALSKMITRPLKQILDTSRQIAEQDIGMLTRQLDSLSHGDVRLQFSVTSSPLTVHSRDELGQTAQAFNEIIYQLLAAEKAFSKMASYLDRMTGTALAIAKNDFSVRVTPLSEHDLLGRTLSDMTDTLEKARSEVARHQDHLEELVGTRTADLEENRRLLFTLMSNLPGMAYRCRNDNDWTMEFVSEGALELTGYPPGSIVMNRDIAYGALIHPQDRDRVWEEIQAAVSCSSPFVIIYRIITRQGETKWVWEKGRGIFSQNDDLIALEGFISDITELKQAEADREKLQEQLTQAQKMESVGRLAGGVAHDFNNMLTVILGFTQAAMDRLDPSDPICRDLTEVRNAAQRSADLTKQLLTFARKQIIDPKVIDLNDTVQQMMDMLQRLMGENIQVAWHPEANLWPVKMDPSQIDQILANLCVNARDAIAGIGKVTLETGMETVDQAHCDLHPEFSPGDFVRLVFTDTGCGMDQKTMDNLFEPFFTTKDLGQGTGLGLATVYGIVKQNNGVIHVYSEKGQGTTFRIYLPRHRTEPDDPAPEIPADPVPEGHETLLVVEDEPAILKMTKMMLAHSGYTVLTAATPGEALTAARNHKGKIHLVLTDVVMPEMTGRDLADRLTSLFPEIKVVFMSGYTADVIARQGILEDHVQFIQKPFSRAELAVKIRQTLQI
ncbi:MAG: response regulator [Desulfotignum sp.]|nr:response regulator [Desulfotignum sp.]MCF8136046.1 response regulator [Desulfotignum sp.]